MKRLVMAGFFLISLCACERSSGGSERISFLSPTPNATQTERVVVWTSTPLATYTPIVKEVTSTPKPEYLCVTAVETVHLRPSPSVKNYPITVLKNGTRLTDLKGRDGKWFFVSYQDKSGWVDSGFVKSCE